LLDQVAAVQPDVIIIDAESPTRDTLEQLSIVSAQQPRPIVLFTEDRASATIQAAVKAGVSAYIVAGMQPERLRPILEVAVARFEQDRALRDELRDVQERLEERKVVERAKGILMKQKGIDEEQAYRLLRKLAMDRNRKLLDIARQVIDVTDLLA
jgi:response regulator NasT